MHYSSNYLANMKIKTRQRSMTGIGNSNKLRSKVCKNFSARPDAAISVAESYIKRICLVHTRVHQETN